MEYELDHFFVLCRPGAPEAEALRSAGLTEGEPNTHPGQGTANRRFFLNRCMLELLWVHDPDEASEGPGSRLKLVERSASETASPFGFVFRPTKEDRSVVPFPSWKYEPEYLDPPLCMFVGTNTENLVEPLCVYLPSVLAPHRSPTSTKLDSVSSLQVFVPSRQSSEVLARLAEARQLEVTVGDEHLLEVVFNGEREGRAKDLRPDLPMLLRW